MAKMAKLCPQCEELVPAGSIRCPTQDCRFVMTSLPFIYKRCPGCKQNVPALEENCGGCGYDMTKVNFFRNCTQCGKKIQANASGCNGCGHAFKVWICLCGAENDEADKMCQCGKLPAAVMNTQVKSGSFLYLLLSEDEQYCVKIDRDPAVIGREPDNCEDYLYPKRFVSKTHLKLNVLEGGELYATDVSRNGTWLNDIRMTKNQSVCIEGGNVISLSGPRYAEGSVCLRVIPVKRIGDYV